MTKGYDEKCYELAKFFLHDGGWTHDVEIAELAQNIQDTIEDFESGLETERDGLRRT